VPDVPPVPIGLQVSMHRAQMSDGTSRSVAQHAHAQIVSAHWPATGIGTFSSEEQVQLSLPSLASHWAMAVYCTLHFVMALTVASASLTQLVWQSATRQALGCDAHIAVQACCRVNPVPEPPDPLPPAPTPPEPARVPPVATPVTPPEAIPPVPNRVPPLPGMPPRDVAPAPELPPSELLLLEQANAKSIAAGRTQRTVPVLCMRKLPPVKGGLPGNSGRTLGGQVQFSIQPSTCKCSRFAPRQWARRTPRLLSQVLRLSNVHRLSPKRLQALLLN